MNDFVTLYKMWLFIIIFLIIYYFIYGSVVVVVGYSFPPTKIYIHLKIDIILIYGFKKKKLNIIHINDMHGKWFKWLWFLSKIIKWT